MMSAVSRALALLLTPVLVARARPPAVALDARRPGDGRRGTRRGARLLGDRPPRRPDAHARGEHAARRSSTRCAPARPPSRPTYDAPRTTSSSCCTTAAWAAPPPAPVRSARGRAASWTASAVERTAPQADPAPRGAAGPRAGAGRAGPAVLADARAQGQQLVDHPGPPGRQPGQGRRPRRAHRPLVAARHRPRARTPPLAADGQPADRQRLAQGAADQGRSSAATTSPPGCSPSSGSAGCTAGAPSCSAATPSPPRSGARSPGSAPTAWSRRTSPATAPGWADPAPPGACGDGLAESRRVTSTATHLARLGTRWTEPGPGPCAGGAPDPPDAAGGRAARGQGLRAGDRRTGRRSSTAGRQRC